MPLTTAEVGEGGVTARGPGYATVRTNPFTGAPEALGVVGYTPPQNEDHAEFLNLLADESPAIVDTAGSLRGGRQVFVPTLDVALVETARREPCAPRCRVGTFVGFADAKHRWH